MADANTVSIPIEVKFEGEMSRMMLAIVAHFDIELHLDRNY